MDNPIGLELRFTYLCAGLTNLNLVLLATAWYNELFTETHMSFRRRHRYIARVSGVKKVVWEAVYLKSKPIGFNFYSSLLFWLAGECA